MRTITTIMSENEQYVCLRVTMIVARSNYLSALSGHLFLELEDGGLECYVFAL